MRARAVHLFAGIGGGAMGFQDAGFETAAAVDYDAAVCQDFEYLTGAPAVAADLHEMDPAEVGALTSGYTPHVVFSSSPCTGFSSCLPRKYAALEKYQRLNELTVRGIFLAVTAWDPAPPLILLENVPRITTRGEKYLRQIVSILRGHGYAVKMSTHDAGEIGHLGQRRKRFLLVARDPDRVPRYVYRPPVYEPRACGEVLSQLPVPVPGSGAGGLMHRLPRMSPLNWLRLALIPAGGDWRKLPPEVALAWRKGRINGGYGVNDWERSSHTVVGEGSVQNAWNSINDPRVTCERREGSMGVTSWEEPSTTVIANGTHHNGPWQVGDPRLTCAPRSTVYGVLDANEPANTVVSAAKHDNGPYSIADARLSGSPHHGYYGVQDDRQPANTVLGVPGSRHGQVVTDPRLNHSPRKGSLGVTSSKEPAGTVIGEATPLKGQAFADSRVLEPTHLLYYRDDLPVLTGPELDLETKKPCYVVIAAPDGTWHRPMTTLELAALQGFPVWFRGDYLQLCGRSHQKWRKRIGNAVPPPAAAAIAAEMMATLTGDYETAPSEGRTRIWVDPEHHAQL